MVDYTECIMTVLDPIGTWQAVKLKGDYQNLKSKFTKVETYPDY